MAQECPYCENVITVEWTEVPDEKSKVRQWSCPECDKIIGVTEVH